MTMGFMPLLGAAEDVVAVVVILIVVGSAIIRKIAGAASGGDKARLRRSTAGSPQQDLDDFLDGQVVELAADSGVKEQADATSFHVDAVAVGAGLERDREGTHREPAHPPAGI